MSQEPSAALDISTEEKPERKRGFWRKLKRGLNMTHTELIDRIGAAAAGRGVIDEEMLEELEEVLIASDLGAETSLELVDSIRERVKVGQAGDEVLLRQMLADEISLLLLDAPRPAPVSLPMVTLVVGVNGAGKTTSIAKLAQRSRDRGEKVLLAAGDTFRAAAIEQLETWADRLSLPVVRHQAGSDPAAVVFDAMQAAKARSIDHVIVDTAGRLHTKTNLMEELRKIGRVVEREAEGWSVQTLLIIDATNGQNGLQQARQFAEVVPVDALFLTKVDGTAKGGVVVAVARAMRVPVAYLGVGEGADDIVDFDAREFARAMLG